MSKIVSQSPSADFWSEPQHILSNVSIQSDFDPVLTFHQNALWCFYQQNNHLSVTKKNVLSAWTNPQIFMAAPFAQAHENAQSQQRAAVTTPTLVDLNGTLHIIMAERLEIQGKNELVHYQYNQETQTWARRTGTGAFTDISPIVVTLGTQLLLCYVDPHNSNHVNFTYWDNDAGWAPITVNGERSWGTMSLVYLEGVLTLVYPSDNDHRDMLNMQYKASNPNRWVRVSGTVSKERAGYGFSGGTNFANAAFVGFTERGGYKIYVSQYGGTSWLNHETINGETRGGPALAMLQGQVHLVFSQKDSRELYWCWRERYGPTDWMRLIDNNTPITSLSIPGTHDSAAILPVPTARCQALTITEQLNLGIRFFDLRCGFGFRPNQDTIMMWHAAIPQLTSLVSILTEIIDWLRVHSDELVLAQIKKDHGDNDNDKFSQTLYEMLGTGGPFNAWFSKEKTPTIGAVRGKIMLFRRFNPAGLAGWNDFGVDLTQWPNNNPSSHFSDGDVNIYAQDEYALSTDPFSGFSAVLNKKWQAIRDFMALAANPITRTYYINYSSAADWGWKGDLPMEPLAFSQGDVSGPGMNVRIRDYLTIKPNTKMKVGIIAMDFPEGPVADLVQVIIQSNAALPA
ncbi:PLC-like phosphodiesterase [Ramaria rubella]|nr:PLC-like phosphodiesterase [Ramaria rubella]